MDLILFLNTESLMKFAFVDSNDTLVILLRTWLSFLNSSLLFALLFLFRVTGSWCLFPALIGQEAGYTPPGQVTVSSQGHKQTRQDFTCTHKHTPYNSLAGSYLTYVFELCKKTVILWKNQRR